MSIGIIPGAMKMPEYVPDQPDIEEHEAEQQRLKRMRKRLAHQFDIADERIEEDERIKNSTEQRNN